MKQRKIAIIGAGLVGSLLGIFLAKRGHQVFVFEWRPDMRKQSLQAGRSINLALSDRGLSALNEVGIKDEILNIAIPMPGRLIHNLDGQMNFQPYGKEGQAIYSVSRSELNIRLVNIAESLGIRFQFEKKCTAINWQTNEISFNEPNQPGHENFQAEIIFGADGAYAASRLQHMLGHQKFDYHQHYIDCGYKELSVPAGPRGSFLLKKNALHIWPRKEYMLIALPNLDGSFTGTLFFPFSGEQSFEKLISPEAVQYFFKKEFPGIADLIPDLTDQFFNNPTSSLVTVQCYPWVRDGKFSLIGDAAHALVPFFGQGMNCGFEDCLVLNQLMDKFPDQWDEILENFQQLRKPDADAIADMAINNFVEMRSKTADPVFLLQKKIEARLHDKFPDKWIPSYSLVTFSTQIRYSEALARGNKQEAIMLEFMKTDNITERWDDHDLHMEIINKVD